VFVKDVTEPPPVVWVAIGFPSPLNTATTPSRVVNQPFT